MTDPAFIRQHFVERFHAVPLLVRSPGRINLIGEHTDYHEGFVLPAAIDRDLVFALAISENESSTVVALDCDEVALFDPRPDKPPATGWQKYVAGTLALLKKKGHLVPSFDCAFGGDLPVGAGLSSSAALTAGLLFGLNHLFGLGLEPLSIARLAQQVENEYLDVHCGVMDPFANLFGKEGHFIKLDCRTMQHEYIPVRLKETRLLLLDTGVRHTLGDSEYNQRVTQCAAVVRHVRQGNDSAKSLRDVSKQLLRQYEHELDSVALGRCSFVISENQRVLECAERLSENDLKAVGAKMFESHAGLRDQYQVSCSELDFLVELARNYDGVLGARMMGAGFGGCTINLLKREVRNDFEEAARVQYREKFKRDLQTLPVEIKGGTALVAR